MANDKLDFLDKANDEPEAVEAVEDQTEPVEAAEAEPEPESIEAEGEKQEDPAPPAESKEADKSIPLTALLDERERRQALQRELDDLRRWKQQQEAAKEAPKAPDFYESPDDRLQYERSQFQQMLMATKMQQSQFLASREYGEEMVNEALAWFDQNPQLSHQFVNHPSPMHAAVEFYKRQKVAEEIGTDPDGYRQRLEAEIREKLMAEMQQGTIARPKPPASLASAPATGKGEPRSRGTAFDAAFGT